VGGEAVKKHTEFEVDGAAPPLDTEFDFHGIHVRVEDAEGTDNCLSCFYKKRMRAADMESDCDRDHVPSCRNVILREVGIIDEDEFKVWLVIKRLDGANE
jgi:hypothetical protein